MIHANKKLISQHLRDGLPWLQTKSENVCRRAINSFARGLVRDYHVVEGQSLTTALKQGLKNLTTKLQHRDLTVEYDGSIQEQLTEGVIKKATPVSKLEKEFYIPHKCVIRKSAETTRMRIVCDASAQATPKSLSLNDCLYSRHPLQNRLWDVLVQQRAYPVVHESKRDAFWFHWQTDCTSEAETENAQNQIWREILLVSWNSWLS